MTDIVERLRGPSETPFAERYEAADTIETLRAALSRQSDNMAFVINHMDLPPQWHLKFTKELDEDRATLGENLMTEPEEKQEIQPDTELSEAQTALRREQAKVQFLGDNLTKIVERFYSLRVVHGDCNATAALAAMQQEINGYNGQLNAIAQADIVG